MSMAAGHHMNNTIVNATSKRKALIIGGGIAGPLAAIALQRAGMDAVVYEARSGPADDAGAFLNLAPNGVSVLKELGIAHRLEDGFPSQGIHFFNSKGKKIGALDSSCEEQQYGAHNVMMKRGLLHKALREEALHQGIRMEFGKSLTDITVTGEQTVVAHFGDGATAQGDFLIGCDGLHSRTRRIMLPDGPSPVFTGIIDCGGYSQLPGPEGVPLPSVGIQQMIFGRSAFFGYIGKPDGEVWWFSNVAWPNEPSRDELKAIHDADWQQRVLALHRDDPAPIPEIIRSLKNGLGKWPIYDMPPLSTWHKGPVCLIGDAAHATSPHVGQGASLAMEDAVVLAKCLRDIPNLELAFSTLQALRKGRVEKIVEQARRMGDRKIPSPVMGWFRDRLLPIFLRTSTAQLAPIYSYKVDWKTKVTQEAVAA